MSSEAKKLFKIALDAMGGDFAPKNEVLGAIEMFKDKPSSLDIEIVFVGDESAIRNVLNREKNISGLKYSIVHTTETVTMNDDPTEALKKKKNSSLYKGLELHANGLVDAFVSGGNTGATLSHATIILGRIKGVSRPTIGSFFPSVKDYPPLLLDVGANVDSKPHFLYEFAIMGSIYANQILKIDRPTVGLLNIGEEEKKGNELARQTYQLLKNSDLNFIGNVEGRDVLLHGADVIICDGFEGNIVLKFAESVLVTLKTKIKNFASKSLLNKLSVGIMLPTLKKILKGFDAQEYGGVPLLGVNGVVIIGHGSSSPKAIKYMLLKAVEIVERDVNKKIEDAINRIIHE